MESPNENHNDIVTVHAGNFFHNKILWSFDCTWRLSIIGNGTCNLNNCLNGVLGINVVFVKHVMNIKKMLGQRHNS